MANTTPIVLIPSSYFIALEEAVYVNSCETLAFLPIFIPKEAHVFNIECTSGAPCMIIYTPHITFPSNASCLYSPK